MMKSSFAVSKIDNINLRKYNIKLSEYKAKIKSILDYLLSLDELKLSKIFNVDINKIRFDVGFCNDNTIQEINNDYRNKNKPTDVITFSLFVDDDNAMIYRKTADLGQIIVSVETADKQKNENNNSLEKEILTLITHGILHLFGFDHTNKKEYDFVVGVQNKVIKNYEQISI